MSTQLLIYNKAVPVNKKQHTDLYVKTGSNFSFAEKINSTPLMAVEFPNAASEYTIVFTGNDKEILPAVILGSQNDENLYYSADKWNAEYVPAFIRRYPFVFSSADKGDTFTLCIDEEFSGCNAEGRGERLFDTDGEQTQYLSNVVNFLKEYQSHFKRTQLFCKKLVELELLEPMGAKFTSPDGTQRSLTGFMAINRDKLKALSGDQLAELAKTDGLELAYLHLQSIRNLSKLAKSEPASQEIEEAAVVTTH